MNFFSRQKVIIWILAGLLIITLSVLGSMIYYSWPEPEEVVEQPACSSSCMMMFEELELNTAQQEKIEQVLDHFKEASAALIAELRQQRLALMEELQTDTPDSLKLHSLSAELGVTQGRITSLAVQQYLQIRAICTPDQRQKLSNIYCDIFGCSRIMTVKEECK